MPTIAQLPSAAQVTAADQLPLSQGGTTLSVRVGALLASMQPAIINASGTLLGRTSLGPGGPEPIGVGIGLTLASATLSANGSDHAQFAQQTSLLMTDQIVLNSGGNAKLLALPLLRGLFSAGANVAIDASGIISATITSSGGAGQGSPYSITGLATVQTIAANDLIAISQANSDHTISYANLLNGLTIDLATPAVAAADTDTLWVAQGSSTMLRQSFGAIWSWLMTKLPSYKLPAVEIVANTTLDGTVHNGRILICSQPVTLSAVPVNMGSGFYCDVLNLSSGTVSLAGGIITSSGNTTLPAGQSAALRGVAYSGGTVVFATLSATAGSTSGGTAPSVPGPIVGLAVSSQTTSSVSLSWGMPISGGVPSGYTVQYRPTGGTSWTSFAVGMTGTAATVTALSAATSYDFQVFALDAQGAGSASVITASTASGNAVTGVVWNVYPTGSYSRGNGSIGVNAHITPGTAPVQFGFSPSGSVPPSAWAAAIYVNTDLWGAYVSTPSTAGIWYTWVSGIDGSLPTVCPTSFTVT